MDVFNLRPIAPRQSRLLMTLACSMMLVTICQPSPADEPSLVATDNAQIGSLIEQLGASNFAEREDANRKLLTIGGAALPELRNAQHHSSVEVRERANRIRVEIDKEVFQQVTKRFILESNSQESFGLPGWNEFRSIAGDARTSKLLFVLMLRNQRDLAQHVEMAWHAKGTAASASALQRLEARTILEAERLRSQSFRGQPPEVGDTVAMLFACSMFNDNVSIEINETIIQALRYGSHMEYFNKAGYGRCMRALTGKWIFKTQSSLSDEILAIAMQQSIPEGVIVARRHLDGSSNFETRVSALQCIARFGNEADIANVAKLLDEETVVYQFTDRSELGALRDGIRVEDIPPPGLKNIPVEDERTHIVRLSDMALAVCMVLSSEDVTKVFPKYEARDARGISLMDVAFPSDGQDQHKLAIANWKKTHPQFVENSN